MTITTAEKWDIRLLAAMKNRRGGCTADRLRTFGKTVIVMGCLAGFLYQTLQFYQMYLEYPTVVDIQVTSPSSIDIPSITICNTIGYKFREICQYFDLRTGACFPISLSKLAPICKYFPRYCRNGKLPGTMQLIGGTRFSQEVVFDGDDLMNIKIDLEEYLNCSIEYAGESRNCNLKAEIGPIYSEYDLPNICYSLYNHWGQPNKQKEKIPKGAVMKLKFNLNATFTGPKDRKTEPKVIIPNSPSVQIGFHSSYFIPSPFLDGSSFVGGEKYEISLKQQEKHLLPAPYQTNCTDYITQWRDSGGRSPINQMGILQKCKLDASLRQFGCAPISVNYPHNRAICPKCGPYTVNKSLCGAQLIDDCSTYIEQFNQPCHSSSLLRLLLTYDVLIKNKLITISADVATDSVNGSETLSEQILSHVCTGNQTWKPECSLIDIDILFEGFEIHNLTYMPKYVILELFSVIGGYMGMWLGVSFIAVYDFVELLSRRLCNNTVKKRKSRRRRNAVVKPKSPTKTLDPCKRKLRYHNHYNAGRSFQ